MVGATGCGKTTFLRMLLGQERADPRQHHCRRRSRLPAEPDRDRGIVFQRYSVFPHLTVLGNVVLGLEFARSHGLGRLFGARAGERPTSEAAALLARSRPRPRRSTPGRPRSRAACSSGWPSPRR